MAGASFGVAGERGSVPDCCGQQTGTDPGAGGKDVKLAVGTLQFSNPGALAMRWLA
jgi:hypothetical protein